MITAIAARENREDAALILWLIKGCQLTIVNKKGQQKKRLVYVDDYSGVLRKNSVGILAVDGTKPIISLADVSNVIDGEIAETMSHDFLYPIKDCCFSLSYGKGCKTWDFIAHNQTTKWAWVRGLTLLVARLSVTSHRFHTIDDIVNYEFYMVDHDRDALISADEALATLNNQLHLTVNDDYIDSLFQMAKSNNPSSENATKGHLLDRKQFLYLVKTLSYCPEIRRIFDQSKGIGSFLNSVRLKQFLQLQQKQSPIDHAVLGNLVRKYELNFGLRGSDCFSYEGFRGYLLSEDNSIQAPESMFDVYHDMTRPLSEYWIFSSHNTYLTAEQFSGQCSLDGYANALRQGCRCVHLDTWDGFDDEPIVTNHGQTFTSKVYFRDVLRTVRDEAFITSPYPVILTIDNHCSITQQRRMIYHLKNILDEMLCQTVIDPIKVDQLLSPEALKFKILIKSKSLIGNYYYQQQQQQQQQPSSAQSTLQFQQQQHYVQPSFSSQSLSRPTSTLSSISHSSQNIGHYHVTNRSSSASSLNNDFAAGRVSPEFSELVAFPSVPMPKFNKRQQPQIVPVHGVSALVESEAEYLAENMAAEIREHTNRRLVRVYPSAMRVSSSNFNPYPALLAGFQLVSLNFQTRDKNYKIYSGFFRDNGQCGYLLKPSQINRMPAMILKIQIISGYQLCRDPIVVKTSPRNINPPQFQQHQPGVDPYVMLFIKGVATDCAKSQTSVVGNNGFNPIWNETFAFRITRPDVALLRFVVADSNDGFTFIGQHSLPVRLVRPGFRSVRLDCDNPYRNSTLLVHVTIEAERH